MYIEHPDQDNLDFSHSTFGDFEIQESAIEVQVFDLWILSGFPGFSEDTHFRDVYVVYENVTQSVREIHRYTDHNRNEFESVEKIEDGPFKDFNGEVYPCVISGVFKTLNAWVEWDIKAAKIKIKSK